jgi:hypothetical protein
LHGSGSGSGRISDGGVVVVVGVVVGGDTMCWQAKNKNKFHWRLHLVVARKVQKAICAPWLLKENACRQKLHHPRNWNASRGHPRSGQLEPSVRVVNCWLGRGKRVRFLILSAQFKFELEFELEKAASSMQFCQADD